MMLRLTLLPLLCLPLLGAALPQKRGKAVIDTLPEDQGLTSLTEDTVTALVEDPQSVEVLATCLLTPDLCSSPTAANLIRDIGSLDASGSCAGCSPEDAARLRRVVTLGVQRLSAEHPTLLLKVMPRLARLIGPLKLA